MKKILCCIPTLGSIRIELAQRLYQWKAKYGLFFDIYSSNIQPLYAARNDCVNTFLSSDASYLFFIDSDAVPNANAVEQLLSHGFGKRVVSGLCHEVKRDLDGQLKIIPLILKEVRGKNGLEYRVINRESFKNKKLVEVDAAGTICVMIHRSVFQAIERPWFQNRAEDFYFYKRAKEEGFQIYVDCECNVQHFVEIGI